MADVRLVRERLADVDPMTFFDHRKVHGAFRLNTRRSDPSIAGHRQAEL
jgi:hypothetical protein